MSDSENTIRPSVDGLSLEQEQYAEQLSESLAALDEYRSYLEQWQTELEHQARELELCSAQLEVERKRFAKERATDAVLAVEMEQARVQLEPQHQENHAETPTEPVCNETATVRDRPSVDSIKRGMNSVAQQFQKLRQQQARRSMQMPRPTN